MNRCKDLIVIFMGLALVPFNSIAKETPRPSEIHELHVRGVVNYRCYSGYGGQNLFDDRTKEPCDNKDYKRVIVDTIIPLKIEDEADPENSKELGGSWLEKFDFKGRKFEIAISLFKSNGPKPYRVRVVATDDEPSPRQTAVFTETKSVDTMNSLQLEYSSVGKKEEITFSTWIEPPFKK